MQLLTPSNAHIRSSIYIKIFGSEASSNENNEAGIFS